MTDLLKVQGEIRKQWDDMIKRGVIPVIEIQTGENDCLIVDIELSEDNTGVIFSFDKDDLDASFSNDIEQVGYNYQLTIDEFNSDLDIYLQQITGEILEGFILPNDLYYCEG